MKDADDPHLQMFGTHSIVGEQEAVRDAYVAELEAALRKIAAGGDAGGSFSGTMSRFSERDSAVCAVGRVVAERSVIHKDIGPTRYVVARLSRAVKD